jgi:hypothetical protein
LEILEKGEKWKPGDSVFGILKVKSIKMKVKKEKAAAAPEVKEEAAVEKQEDATPVANEKREARK